MPDKTDRSRRHLPDSAFYCHKHERSYHSAAGCPFCRYEHSPPTHDTHTRVRKCPVCAQMSLLWYQCAARSLCVNLDCPLSAAPPPAY